MSCLIKGDLAGTTGIDSVKESYAPDITVFQAIREQQIPGPALSGPRQPCPCRSNPRNGGEAVGFADYREVVLKVGISEPTRRGENPVLLLWYLRHD